MTDTILTMPPTPPKPSEQIAALQCTLEQAYLIEASAGTGKTWTLTGIILRLLIEKNIRLSVLLPQLLLGRRQLRCKSVSVSGCTAFMA